MDEFRRSGQVKRVTCSAFVLSLLFAASAYASPVTIDTFETPTPFVLLMGGTGAQVRADTGPGIFGFRELITFLRFGDLVILGEGLFVQIATAEGEDAFLHMARLRYEFPGVQDFSGDLGVELRFLFLDAPGVTGATTTQFHVSLNTSAGQLTHSFTLLDSFVPFTVVLPFSSFTGPGNLAAVSTAVFMLNAGGATQQGTDFGLDYLAVIGRVAPPPEPVSEPSTITLMASGLLAASGAWCHRWNRRRMA